MTDNDSAVKVKCTSLCNNFFYATKIRDEAQGRARAGDPPEDHRGRRGAAPDRGTCADTVSAVAEKAGVQRHTYYAHFPELKNLYQACMGHYSERNPVPEPSSWADIADAEERLRVRSLRSTPTTRQRGDGVNVLRDAALDPIVQGSWCLSTSTGRR